MKTTLLALGLLATVSAAEPVDGLITLKWDGQAAWTNGEIIRIHHTTDITLPPASWAVITNVPATNLSVSLTVVPGPNFFSATVSNFWGQSDFSNVASTPALPRGGENLSVRKGS